MAQSLDSSMGSQRRGSKHDSFLELVPTMETQLESNHVAFTTLQDLCAGQNIVPRPAGAVAAKGKGSEAESVSVGPSVRDFLHTVAESIHRNEALYDKFAHVLSLALGQDSLHVVLGEATSHPGPMDRLATIQVAASRPAPVDHLEVSDTTSDSVTELADVFPPEEEPEHNVNDGVIGLPVVVEPQDVVNPIDAVDQPIGAMALGDRNVVRRRNWSSTHDEYTALMLRDLSTTARHERSTRRVLESNLSNATRENKDLKTSVERLCLEKDNAFQEFQRLSGEREVERQKYECQMTKLKKSIAEREAKVDKLRKERRECKTRIENQSIEIEAQKSKGNALTCDIDSLQRTLEEVKERKAEVECALQATNLKLSELMDERDELIIQQGALVKTLNEEIVQCKHRIEQLICQLSKEKVTCSRQLEQIEELRIIERLYREDKCFVLSFLALVVAATCLIVVVSLYAWLS